MVTQTKINEELIQDIDNIVADMDESKLALQLQKLSDDELVDVNEVVYIDATTTGGLTVGQWQQKLCTAKIVNDEVIKRGLGE